MAPGHPAHLGHVGDVIRSVICDARGEAVARAVRPGLLDGMRELEERVEALYGEIIPEGEADYEEDAIMGIVRLSDAVIGPKPASRRFTSSTGGTSSSGGAGRTCAGS